ncbi:MAG: isoaspartyl peptidase/L-asparaginase, partial [Planctomycetota bacterium]
MRLVLLSVLLVFATHAISQETELSDRWAIAIHGGAGNQVVPGTPRAKIKRDAMESILRQAVQQIEDGGKAIDVVSETIKRLEDSDSFNAGLGAVLNAEGNAELDASIMDGKTRSCGAV